MAKPLKIYLADLTYDTVTLATEAFPLNVGFIAAYCKKQFGDKIEIKIFKYIPKLEKAIEEEPPDVLGLSNYAWSHNISSEMFKILAVKNPQAIKIWGGPNFPIDLPSQKEFMKKHYEIDAYVPVDGETGFSNIVGEILKLDSLEQMEQRILEKPIDGCITRNRLGEIQFSIPTIRIKKLDEIPSPYTSGLLDEFFDGKLTPMIQTNRGCPFHCTFCTDGKDEVNQVNMFGLDRIRSELNYISKHVPENTPSLHISDLNFGMYPRDQEICEELANMQEKVNYPKFIKCTTGKNQREKIIQAIRKLSDSLRITMSVQSLDEQVLTNIRRSNISVDQMLELYPAIKKSGLQTTSEVILGLPGETYQNHIETLRGLVHARMDEIVVHTCMLLDGSEMKTPEEMKKWDLKTKFRVIQRDFAKLNNGKNIVEIEEVVVGSNTLTFEEYVELRLLAFIIFVTNKGIVFEPIIKFLLQNNIDAFDLYYEMMKKIKKSPQKVILVSEKFKEATINELWDSPEEILKNYSKDIEYNKLLSGEDGTQVIYHYLAEVVITCMNDWVEHVISTAQNLIQSKKWNEITEEQFKSISNYCRGLSHNVMGEDRMKTVPKYEFNYDVQNWVNEKNDLSIEKFRVETKEIEFTLTEEQFRVVQNNIDVYGNSQIGKSKALKMIPIKKLWRTPTQTN
jgi:tRNA A37 methylthiotransferase MiaB